MKLLKQGNSGKKVNIANLMKMVNLVEIVNLSRLVKTDSVKVVNLAKKRAW